MKRIVWLLLAALLLLGCVANDASSPKTPSSTPSVTASSGTASWSGWPWKPMTPLTAGDFGADAKGAQVYALAAPEVRIMRAHFSVIKPSSWISAYALGEQYKAGQAVGNAPADGNTSMDYVQLYPVELRPPVAAGVPASADASTFSVISAAYPAGPDAAALRGASISIDGLDDPDFRALAAKGPKNALLSLKNASRDWELAGFPSEITTQNGGLIQERALTVFGSPAYEIVMNRPRYVEADILVVPGPDSPGLFIQMFYGNGNAYTYEQAKADLDKIVQSIRIQN